MFHSRRSTPLTAQRWAVRLAATVAVAIAFTITTDRAISAGDIGETSETAANGADIDRLSSDEVFPILGKDVLSATGEKMGRIIDVLFDRAGKPCAAIIDFGGFLGVGTRKIAVQWTALRLDLGEKKNIIVLDLGREQLRAAPEFRESLKSIPVIGLPELGPSQALSEPSR